MKLREKLQGGDGGARASDAGTPTSSSADAGKKRGR